MDLFRVPKDWDYSTNGSGRVVYLSDNDDEDHLEDKLKEKFIKKAAGKKV
jgi:hypothetical protein